MRTTVLIADLGEHSIYLYESRRKQCRGSSGRPAGRSPQRP
jgi:hypothetical protein